MTNVPDEQFEEIVGAAIRSIPERFASHLENITFLISDEPTPEQLKADGELHEGVTLLGLYEGVPIPARAGGYTGIVPDVITIFKFPHEKMAANLEALKSEVKQTVWHEVAHYFGLDHDQIEELE